MSKQKKGGVKKPPNNDTLVLIFKSCEINIFYLDMFFF